MRVLRLICTVFFLTTPAVANDSSASMGAGGLAYTTSSLIRIERETLVVGANEVHVSYDFLNTGEKDISTLVAFPLPDLEFDGDWNYSIDSADPVNWIDFHVWVDGVVVTPKVEARANRFGVDVTDVLERYGIPITMLDRSSNQMEELDAKLNALPPDAKAELLRYGVVDWTSSWGADNVPSPSVHWTSHIAFYWFQTFPAGKTLHVEHRYRPVPGRSFVSADTLDDGYLKDTFCIDKALRQRIEARLRTEQNEMLSGTEIGYVLSTGGNWLGPIGHFSLRIEARADDMVASCWKGLATAGGDALVYETDNFQPDDDLRFLLIEPINWDP
jgi:hypothetical protein